MLRECLVKEIAAKLAKSYRTVEAQIQMAHRQLGVRNRIELADKLRGRE